MRQLLLSIQILFIMVFSVALISSFFVVDSIRERSTDAVTDKVVHFVSSKIEIAEELINSKAASNYLADYQMEAIRDEINDFRENPSDYVEAMTLDESKTQIVPPDLLSKNPLKNKLVEKIFSWKSSIKTYFEKTFDGLILDIRIFLISTSTLN